MTERAQRFLAYRATSKTLKALVRHVDCEVVAIEDDSEIVTLHDVVTRDAAREANYDYSDAESLVLVKLVATRSARRFAYFC
jgi:hypothetical protein